MHVLARSFVGLTVVVAGIVLYDVLGMVQSVQYHAESSVTEWPAREKKLEPLEASLASVRLKCDGPDVALRRPTPPLVTTWGMRQGTVVWKSTLIMARPLVPIWNTGPGRGVADLLVRQFVPSVSNLEMVSKSTADSAHIVWTFRYRLRGDMHADFAPLIGRVHREPVELTELNGLLVDGPIEEQFRGTYAEPRFRDLVLLAAQIGDPEDYPRGIRQRQTICLFAWPSLELLGRKTFVEEPPPQLSADSRRKVSETKLTRHVLPDRDPSSNVPSWLAGG